MMQARGAMKHFIFSLTLTCFACVFPYGCTILSPVEEILNQDEQKRLCIELNSSVDGLIKLVQSQTKGLKVNMFFSQRNSTGNEVYRFELEDGTSVSLLKEIRANASIIPILSVEEDNGEYYWKLNDNWLVSNRKDKVKVLDLNNTPHFLFSERGLRYTLGTNDNSVSISRTGSKNVSIVNVDYLYENNSLVFSLPTQLSFELSLRDQTSLIKQNVQNEVYYKDIFLDAGVGLTSRKSLYAAQALDLSLEGISFSRDADNPEEIDLQYDIIAGTDEDQNGRLLYPDGQPRYKLLFVNGGSSTTHGKSLGEDARKRMQAFVANGGSYVGTCAGAFFASSGYDSHEDYSNYLHLWPGVMNHTGISSSSTDMTIEKESPLLNYYDFGGDYYVSDVRHNKGGYPVSLPDGTKVLAKYYCPDIEKVHQKPSIWSYKANTSAGLVIMEGSHPEEVGKGERLDLTAAMILYAIDGRGPVSLKGFLKNDEIRVMDKTTLDNQPEYSRIGDMQCHHFAVFIPKDVKNIRFEVEGEEGSELILRINQQSYAFPSNAEFVSKEKGNKQSLYFPDFSDGVTYVSVQCMTVPTVDETEYGQNYTDRTYVLNGLPYIIKVSWEE